MADRELDKLARYMVSIANVPDFRSLAHKVSIYVLRGLDAHLRVRHPGLANDREEFAPLNVSLKPRIIVVSPYKYHHHSLVA